VSYTYDLADHALTQFRALDPWLAEEVLDEMEILAHEEPSNLRRSSGGFVHDFVRQHGADSVYVFLTVIPDTRNQVLRIANIGLYVRHGNA
jgi:hypothetical protein